MDLYSEVDRREKSAAGDGGTVRVLVLGPLLVEHRGRTVYVAGTHRRRLLAFLASRAGQVVAISAIVDALWGEDPPSTASRTVQSHVARLRGSLSLIGREVIETTSGGYRLAGVEVDADSFERLAGEGRRRLIARVTTGAIAVLSDALTIWRGSPYGDFPEVEFADHERARLADVHATALDDLAEARLESGAVTLVTSELERLVAEHPGRERAWGLLMRALYGVGRQHDALVAFQRARRSLAEMFGLEPGPQLRALERRVLEQDPSLTIVQRRELPAALHTGTDDFFGRAAELAWLTEAWETARCGRGQLRVLLGPRESGRTRLAAQLAGSAAADAAVLYARGADDVAAHLSGDPDRSTPSVVVGAVAERSRHQPVLIVVDDVEWSSASTMGRTGRRNYWNSWRPITAIREADSDGNPTTAADPSWTPLFATPPFPEHPSGHTCISGAIVETLGEFFGTDKVSFSTFSTMSNSTREFDRFSEAIKEIIDARVWAGIHFRTADVQGYVIGKKVSHWLAKHYFRPASQ